METTFAQYINNPQGMKNAVISHREMYRAMYSAKLDTIYVHENGKIDYKVYKSKKDYYIHFKIPSEVIEDFYYDVVVQFSPPSVAQEVQTTISNYNVRFYSNDPSFVYTFAHAFLKNDLLISDLKPRMSKEALKQVAKEKNPDNQIGYVKSLYFTYLIMENKNLFAKIRLDSMANNYDKNELLSDVMDADEKVKLRQEAKPKSKKKENKSKLPDEERPEEQPNRHITKRSSTTSMVKKTPMTASVNKVKRTKRVKRV